MKIFQSCLLGFLAVASAATRDKPVLSIQSDLDYDQNGKLVTNNLYYPADNPNCPAASFQAPYGFVTVPLAGQALQQVFPGYEEGSGACPIACQDKGVDRAVAYAVMPHKQNLDSASNFDGWFEQSCKRTEVCKFRIVTSMEVDVFSIFNSNFSSNDFFQQV